MEQREKLIELLSEHHSGNYAEAKRIADHLIANDVVVLLCRCGECAYHTLEEPGLVYCPHVIGGWVSDDSFCRAAKRKGGDE